MPSRDPVVRKNPGPDLAGGGHGAQLTWGHYVGDCKSLKSRTHISRTKNKYEGFGGRPPVGAWEAWGLGPLPPP